MGCEERLSCALGLIVAGRPLSAISILIPDIIQIGDAKSVLRLQRRQMASHRRGVGWIRSRSRGLRLKRTFILLDIGLPV